MDRIKIGIVGYGNVGKGVKKAIFQNSDMELVGIFTRRNPESIKEEKVYSVSELDEFKNKIDVLILCGGSKSDLFDQCPELAKSFNTIDSFDTHARIPEYYERVNCEAIKSKHISLISAGWDPGIFSLFRVLSESVLPKGFTHTFWGKGVSQGHSDAIRRIKGVKMAIQYTIPNEEALSKICGGINVELPLRAKIKRECFVVAQEDADKSYIEKEIVTMPNYFDEYETTVNFIDEETFTRDHSSMPHGGDVVRLNDDNLAESQMMRLNLKLGSNPDFTGSVLAAYARAIVRLYSEGKTGALTVLDIPVSYMSSMSKEELLKSKL